jgi:hypothetical protein
MRTEQLDWQQAALLAAGLGAVSVAARHSTSKVLLAAAAYFSESALVAGLYSLWQLAGSLSVVGGGAGAFSRARWILRFEQSAHLPSELDLQHLVNHHPLIEQACNLFYAGVHFAALGIFLLWLFIRHRDRYAQVRLVVVLLTLSCLLIQLLPVAPPRLLPAAGFVDTAALYGQSVYHIAGVTTDQLSAMPSVHVGWATLVAWGVITVSESRWRWAILAHPAVTIFVVVATANHFWLDGIVAIVLLGFSILLSRLFSLSRLALLGRLRASKASRHDDGNSRRTRAGAHLG